MNFRRDATAKPYKDLLQGVGTDQAHENAFAKALESLGVNWGKVLPIPKTNAEQFPEVKKLLDQGASEHAGRG